MTKLNFIQKDGNFESEFTSPSETVLQISTNGEFPILTVLARIGSELPWCQLTKIPVPNLFLANVDVPSGVLVKVVVSGATVESAYLK